MNPVRLTIACAALLAVAPPAYAVHASAGPFPVSPARVAAPLEGEGENIQIVANLDIGGGAEEIELAGDYAYLTGPDGLHIADISNPLAPKQVSTICPGGFGDVGLNAEATIAILAADGNAGECAQDHPEGSTGGVVVVDVSNKSAPVFKSFIPAAQGAHTATIDNDLVIVNQYDPQYQKAEIWSIANPVEPKKIGEWTVDGTAFHDSYVDRRPDGKVYLYGASISASDVIDFTDPTKPVSLQRIYDPEVGIQHQLEPNHKRDVLLLTDEYGGGAAGPVCGKSPSADATYMAPVIGAPQDVGAIHFYKAAADGTFSTSGVDKVGTFNIPVQENEGGGGCTSHVFWQAPDQNRFSIAWYQKGTRLVDFTDPAKPVELGWFIPADANTWSAKPHRGYIFTSDLSRGMDVLKYTGEGGSKWPATAGDAAVQRAAQQGKKILPGGGTVPAPPTGTVPGGSTPQGRSLGTFSVRTKKVRLRKGTHRVVVRDASNRVVARATLRVRKSARRVVRLSGSAETGGYRYFVTRGRKSVARGGFSVKPRSGARVPVGEKMTLRAR